MKDTQQLIAQIQNKRGQRPIAEITAYDYPMARMIDEAGFDLILVGDSLGMVMMGHPDTTSVTMEHMEHHIRIVANGAPNTLIIGDLPINSYDSPEQALSNARRLIAAGADAVKLEGGQSRESAIRAIVEAGIPLQAHIGLLPQSVKGEGYRMKGKSEEEAQSIIKDMQAVVRAGAFSLVIECTRHSLAAQITAMCPIPTIGIGSGHGTCDGEVTVYHDIVGAFPWFVPSFVEPKAHINKDITRAIKSWRDELQIPQP